MSTAHEEQYLEIHTALPASAAADDAFLAIKKLTRGHYGPNILLIAAKHNKRAMSRDATSRLTIDPARSHLNEVLRGPATADGVARLARDKMKAAGIDKPRKNAVLGLELVFSLAPGHPVSDERAYFEQCWRWSAQDLCGEENVLSVDIHRDEAAVHCHVLVLPLVDGRLVGSDLMGNQTTLLQRMERFYQAVAIPARLRPPRRARSRSDRVAAARQLMRHLEKRGDPILKSQLWPVVYRQMMKGPEPFAQLLGI
jgi:hypothetical protein